MKSNKQHPAIIAYDISSNRRRRRFQRTLQDWRLEGQKSVVETLLSRAQAEELFLQLSGDIDPETDRLALVWVQRGTGVRTAGCASAATALRYRG